MIHRIRDCITARFDAARLFPFQGVQVVQDRGSSFWPFNHEVAKEAIGEDCSRS